MKRVSIATILLVFGITSAVFAKTYDLSQVSQVKPVTEYPIDTAIDELDTVTFGSYPQSDASGATKESIEWIVLENSNGKALLLSKYILAKHKYNDEQVDITWENCTMRRWLNSEYINTIFSKEEQDSILTIDVINNDNAQYGTKGGNDTKDKLFLLSIDEVKKYLSAGKERVVGRKGKESLFWWLRSPARSQEAALHVDPHGKIRKSGMRVNYPFGVRPAIWVTSGQISGHAMTERRPKGNPMKGELNLRNIKKMKCVKDYDASTTIDEMDTVTFGFDHHEETYHVPIEWLVLDKQGDDVLLLSKYIIDYKPYNNKEIDVSWETCKVRDWLNGYFYLKAFSSSEKDKIKTTNVLNEANSDCGTTGGNNTNDKIFLLSIEEAKTYFGNYTATWNVSLCGYEFSQNVATRGTYYSKSKDPIFKDSWWLRSPGGSLKCAAEVSHINMLPSGDYICNEVGVRPAMWVTIK